MRVKTMSPARSVLSSSRSLRVGIKDSPRAATVFIGLIIPRHVTAGASHAFAAVGYSNPRSLTGLACRCHLVIPARRALPFMRPSPGEGVHREP